MPFGGVQSSENLASPLATENQQAAHLQSNG
jgi:hypothetical protein